jgi:uncharacterized membrane protein
MRNKLLSIMALFVISILALPLVSALGNDHFGWDVEINGDQVFVGEVQDVLVDANGDGVIDALDNGATEEQVIGQVGSVVGTSIVVNNEEIPTVTVEEGDVVDIEVSLFTGDAVEDIEVEARIKGYEYSRYEPMRDSTRLFDMSANTQKTVRLELDLPRDLEKDVYWLHLTIDSANSKSVERIVKLNVEPARHGVDIADVSFSPGNTVKAGRSLLTSVLLENFGDDHEDDVKVTVSIPTLGVTASRYVDEVETDGESNVDYTDVEEMFLPIPSTAAEGDYEVVVKAEYDRFEEVVETYTIHVVGDSRFQDDDETLVLAVGPEMQNVNAGSAARYAVALTNAGSKSRAYLLSAIAGDWASVSLSDALVVLESGKNKVVYVDVNVAANAIQGAQTVALTISADNEVLETVSLGANVVASPSTASSSDVSLRNGLEIALIVLVVILVIIGLIIGFSRLRRDESDEEKAYY